MIVKRIYSIGHTQSNLLSVIVDKIQVAIFVEFYDDFYCTCISQETPDTEYTRRIGSSL